MRKQDMVLDTLEHVDFSEMKLPGIVVYENPSDYGGKVVGRVFEMAMPYPTNVVIVRESLEEARDDIRAAGFRTVVGRDKADEEQVVETWM